MKFQVFTLSLILMANFSAGGCKSFAPRRPIGSYNAPPAQMMQQPGPGVGGPGPGVMMMGPGAGGQALGQAGRGHAPTTQVAFVGPEGMAIHWDVDRRGAFDSDPLICPGRHNFPQGAIYRLKLTNVPGRAGEELYPTLEIGPSTPRTDAYLAHTPVPVQFTEEDFDQVQSGNFVTKVIYLPDPEFQELALAGVETLVSTRLDPGVDPIVEADRRGAILAIVRLGGKDLELPGGEGFGGEHVVPVAYQQGGMALGVPSAAMAPVAGPPHFVSGVTGPQWGMPISGTPIGLPGPPHVPLGGPAGLQKHVIKNRTFTRIPKPTKKFKIKVKQRPGLTYPKPVSRVSITERVFSPWGVVVNPWSNRKKLVQ